MFQILHQVLVLLDHITTHCSRRFARSVLTPTIAASLQQLSAIHTFPSQLRAVTVNVMECEHCQHAAAAATTTVVGSSHDPSPAKVGRTLEVYGAGRQEREFEGGFTVSTALSGQNTSGDEEMKASAGTMGTGAKPVEVAVAMGAGAGAAATLSRGSNWNSSTSAFDSLPTRSLDIGIEAPDAGALAGGWQRPASSSSSTTAAPAPACLTTEEEIA